MPEPISILAKIFAWSFILKWVKRIVLGFLLITILPVLLFKFVPVPVTPIMLQKSISMKLKGEEVKLYKEWVPLDEISPYLQLSVVCAEDQNYLKHNGFDFGAIEKAVKYNEKMEERGSGKRRGASTITQQTAKNLFLWTGRSWIRKGLEAWFTLLIELFWSKERIMEVYLNIIEFGRGVYGAEAASHEFLNKSAIKLSAKDAALMAVVLPNPLKFSLAKPSAYTRGRQAWCLQQMKFHGMKLDYEKYD